VIDVTSGGRGDLPGTTPAFSGAPNDTSPAIPGSIVDNAVQPNLASTVPDEVVQAVFADVVSGIISTPAGITNLSPGGVVAAEDPIHAPEPATLVLFASGLIVAAHRLRRRR